MVRDVRSAIHVGAACRHWEHHAWRLLSDDDLCPFCLDMTAAELSVEAVSTDVAAAFCAHVRSESLRVSTAIKLEAAAAMATPTAAGSVPCCHGIRKLCRRKADFERCFTTFLDQTDGQRCDVESLLSGVDLYHLPLCPFCLDMTAAELSVVETEAVSTDVAAAFCARAGERAATQAKAVADLKDAIAQATTKTAANVDQPLRMVSAELKQQQAHNFAVNNGTVVVAVHITHSGGTTLCKKFAWHQLRPLPLVVDRMCNVPPAFIPWEVSTAGQTTTPSAWLAFFTAWLPSTNFLSFEFSAPTWFRDFSTFPFGSPHVLSLIVLRHPIARLLSDPSKLAQLPEDVLRCNTSLPATSCGAQHHNNFALRILSGVPYPNQIRSDHLQHAKAVLDRFSVVLDIACYGDGLAALSSLLELPDDPNPVHTRESGGGDAHATIKSQIGNDAYRKLLEINKYDIELYEYYAKSISLHRCDDVMSAEVMTGRRANGER